MKLGFACEWHYWIHLFHYLWCLINSVIPVQSWLCLIIGLDFNYHWVYLVNPRMLCKEQTDQEIIYCMLLPFIYCFCFGVLIRFIFDLAAIMIHFTTFSMPLFVWLVCHKFVFIGKHTIFGRVCRGMEIIKRLGSVQTDNTDRYAHWVIVLGCMHLTIFRKISSLHECMVLSFTMIFWQSIKMKL